MKASRRLAATLQAGRVLTMVCAVAVGLSACGGSGGGAGGADVRDFSAIEVGKTELRVAADGRSAVVRLETQVPTVCAIAYGPTDALGSIANDPAMGGTAISDHTVLLRGLAPDTTYRYRLTATDAKGRVFQTRELATFTTTAGKRATPRRDIAQGARIVAVSSQWSHDYRAANAVDGDLSSEWSSAGDGNRAFVTIDLGRERKVSGVSFVTRAMSNGTAITRTFAVVVDGGKRYGPFPAGNPVHPRVASVSFTGRRLRFDVVTSTGGNTGAAEIQVYAG